jgi:Protein of unknown function (DUF2959)
MNATQTMKTSGLRILGVGSMFTALLLAGAGCKTTNYQTGVATSKDIQATADQVERARGRLDVALAALNLLVNNPSNMPAQYATFTSTVADLQTSAKYVAAKIKSMRTKGTEYFKNWDEQAAQIQNEHIKSRSVARKQEMQNRFTKITMSSTTLGDSYRPLMADLQDIQTALGTDLTVGGIAAIQDDAKKANQDAIPLRKVGADLVEQLRDLSTAMADFAPPPAPPAPPTATASK